jgi:hypothetical protein
MWLCITIIIICGIIIFCLNKSGIDADASLSEIFKYYIEKKNKRNEEH